MQCMIQGILTYSYNNMSEDYFYIPIASIYHPPVIFTITVNYVSTCLLLHLQKPNLYFIALFLLLFTILHSSNLSTLVYNPLTISISVLAVNSSRPDNLEAIETPIHSTCLLFLVGSIYFINLKLAYTKLYNCSTSNYFLAPLPRN